MGFCPVGFCPSGVLSQWGFVLHSLQSEAQTVLIELSDKYNVCCHGNSSAYGLHSFFKAGYLISNAFVNMGCVYVGYLCSLCNCIHIKFTETWNILDILLLASLY